MGCEKGRLLIAFPPTDGFKTDLMKKSGTVIYFAHSFFFFLSDFFLLECFKSCKCVHKKQLHMK